MGSPRRLHGLIRILAPQACERRRERSPPGAKQITIANPMRLARGRKRHRRSLYHGIAPCNTLCRLDLREAAC